MYFTDLVTNFKSLSVVNLWSLVPIQRQHESLVWDAVMKET